MRQALRVQQIPQLVQESCDYGIEPKIGTTLRLGLLLIEGQLCPVVSLSREGRRAKFVFQQGYDPQQFFAPDKQGLMRQWRIEAHALLMFDEDPTDETVIIAVFYHETRLEFETCQEELADFLSFPYAYEFDDAEEDADIYGLNAA